MSESVTTGICPTCSAAATIAWERIYGNGGQVIREDPIRFTCHGNGCTFDPLELNKRFKDEGPAPRV